MGDIGYCKENRRYLCPVDELFFRFCHLTEEEVVKLCGEAADKGKKIPWSSGDPKDLDGRCDEGAWGRVAKMFVLHKRLEGWREKGGGEGGLGDG